MEEKIEVPDQVIIDIRMVRDSGKYNMFESQNVFNELYYLGCYSTVSWLYDKNWNGNQYKSQVDYKKYYTALRAMADLITITNKLKN